MQPNQEPEHNAAKVALKSRRKAERARDLLLETAQTLGIITATPYVTEDNVPAINIAPGQSPFVRQDGHFYCFASELAAHVRALLSQADVRFQLIEDEQSAQNIWARIRLTFLADVKEIARDSSQFDEICAAIGKRHGPVLSVIKPFIDFHLFEITPISGILVTGFASAYDVKGPGFELADHLTSS
jgi:hypothetical protein